jgi:hypothetical protein
VQSLPFHGLFALGLTVYAFVLQLTTWHLASIDGYFHIRYSALLRDAGWRGFPPEYPWLPLTILAPDRYFDHHFLFHWWLALFTGIDLVMGAKIAAAIGAAAAFVTLYGVLVHFGVRHAHWWMLAGLSVAPGLQSAVHRQCISRMLVQRCIAAANFFRKIPQRC